MIHKKIAFSLLSIVVFVGMLLTMVPEQSTALAAASYESLEKYH
ncbi:hypothetical protein [Sporosarcina sp. BP05]|nr:hypothetical protein [Sporosarcina sp. BP05]